MKFRYLNLYLTLLPNLQPRPFNELAEMTRSQRMILGFALDSKSIPTKSRVLRESSPCFEISRLATFALSKGGMTNRTCDK